MRPLAVMLFVFCLIDRCVGTTTNIFTVKPGGGGDYASLSAWESARAAAHAGSSYNLVTDDCVEIASCYGGTDTTPVSFHNWATDAGHFLQIETPTSERHSGKWDASKYNLNVADAQLFNCPIDYTKFIGIQFGLSSQTKYIEMVYMSGHTQELSFCIVRGMNSSQITRGMSVIYGIKLWNCLFYDIGANVSSVAVQNHGDSQFYSCTFIGGGIQTINFNDVGSTCVAKNCYAGGASSHTLTGGGSTVTMVTCATSDTDGSVGLQNIPISTANFVNCTAGGASQDYHLVGGSSLIGTGTDTSGDASPFNFTTDIDGQTRTVPWSVGADQYIAPGPKTILVSDYGDGSPSWANASNAVYAAVAGDTVLFPSSTGATWSGTLKVSKAITINGNNCILTNGANLSKGFFWINTFTSSVPCRITRFTFKILTSVSTTEAINGSEISLTQLRIDHNTFTNGYVQIEVGGAWGVIDHNVFYNGNSALYIGAGERWQQDLWWATMDPGTGNFLFIEDNCFTNTADITAFSQTMDMDGGGKIVLRHNITDFTTQRQATGGQYWFQCHGNACGGCATGDKAYWENDITARRSPQLIEIYENLLVGYNLNRWGTFRGGSILCYSNTITDQSDTPGIVMYEEEADLVSQFFPSRTNWPAEDQVHNSFFWSNTVNGALMTGAGFTIIHPTFIDEDRDYFLHAPQANGGKESFTGLNGGSSTYPTDGDTYPTLGNMTFSASGANAYYPYTPYIYPHPLVSGHTNVANITNVRVQNLRIGVPP